MIPPLPQGLERGHQLLDCADAGHSVPHELGAFPCLAVGCPDVGGAHHRMSPPEFPQLSLIQRLFRLVTHGQEHITVFAVSSPAAIDCFGAHGDGQRT